MFKLLLLTLFVTLSCSSNVVIATGGVTGNYFKMGKDLNNKLFNKEAKVINTEGSVENMLLVAKGKADIAFVQADVLPLLELFDKEHRPYREIVDVAGKMYTEVLHVIAHKRSDITNLSDLNGKVVSFGGSQSGNSVTASYLKEHNNLEFSSVKEYSVKKSLDLIEKGKLDALFYVTKAPATILNKYKNLKLVKISAKVGRDSKLKKVTLKSSAYKVLFKNLKTFAVDTYVITKKGFKDSDKVKAYLKKTRVSNKHLIFPETASEKAKKRDLSNVKLISFDEETLKIFKKRFGNPSLVRLKFLMEKVQELQNEKIAVKLSSVNKLVNRLRFLSDEKLWKVDDYWASPLETIGAGSSDSEERALLKKMLLIKLGVDPKKLTLIKRDDTFTIKRETYDENYALLYQHKKGAEPIVLEYVKRHNKLYKYDNQFVYKKIVRAEDKKYKAVVKRDVSLSSIDKVFNEITEARVSRN